MTATPNLSLPLLAASQAQKHVTVNEALARLDALVQIGVLDRDLATPPGTPAEGDAYIVAGSATGAWAGWEGNLAVFTGGAWARVTPREGWLAWVADEDVFVRFDGAAWVEWFQNLTQLGIGTSADATNRLAVAAAATLLSHEGAGHQLKINKALAADTASLLFQTGFSGRAEMGTAGDDDWSIKVSADGLSWAEAIVIAAATGIPDLRIGATIGGSEAFHRGNILGTVSQSGGVPTGRLIEHGSNMNGEYVRFAGGLQICLGEITLTQGNNTACVATWIFPAAYSAPPSGIFLALDENSLAAATPAPTEMGLLSSAGETVTSATLRQYRANGNSNFAPGDTLVVRATAFGRWF